MSLRGLDKYLEPPDEPEAKLCESCGEECELVDEFDGHYADCSNPFCPDRHTGIAKEMAEIIVEQKDDIQRLKMKLRLAEMRNNGQ